MSDRATHMSAEDEAFVRRAGEIFREQADGLDAPTRSRLNQARQKALAAGKRPALIPAWLADQWAPACGAMLAVLVATGIWFGTGSDTGPDAAVQQALITVPDKPDQLGDLEVLLADENLEMIEELEFFSWMDPNLSPEQLQEELESIG